MRCCNCGKSLSSSGAFCSRCFTFHPSRKSPLGGLFVATIGAAIGAASFGIIFDRGWAFFAGGLLGLVIGSIIGTIAEVISAARNSSVRSYGDELAQTFPEIGQVSVSAKGLVFKINGVQQSTQADVTCEIAAMTETNARAKAELSGIAVRRVEKIIASHAPPDAEHEAAEVLAGTEQA